MNWELWCRYGKVVMAQRGREALLACIDKNLKHHPGVSQQTQWKVLPLTFTLCTLFRLKFTLCDCLYSLRLPWSFHFEKKKKKSVKSGVEGTKGREKLMWEWKENIICLALIHLESSGNPHLKSLCIFCVLFNSIDFPTTTTQPLLHIRLMTPDQILDRND